MFCYHYGKLMTWYANMIVLMHNAEIGLKYEVFDWPKI